VPKSSHGPAERRRFRFAGTTLFLLLAAIPAVARGQAGIYVTPSVSISEVYDDNIFNTSSNDDAESPLPPVPGLQATRRDREDDFITRGGAGLNGGYRSQPFTLLVGYEFEGESYADHTDQSTVPSSQRAHLESTYASARRSQLSLHGEYAETKQSRDLNSLAFETIAGPSSVNGPLVPVTTLETPRARSELYEVGPSLRYDLDPLTSSETGFTYSHGHQVGSSTNDTYVASLDLSRKLDPRNSIEAGYDYRHFEIDQPNDQSSEAVDADGDRKIDSHGVTVGGRHDFSPTTTLHVRGGARFTEGEVDPQVSADLDHELQRGKLGLRYEETVTTGVGVTDVLRTRGAVAFAAYDLSEFLTSQVTLSYYRNSERSGADADIYRAGVSLSYRLLEWLSIRVSYDFRDRKSVV